MPKNKKSGFIIVLVMFIITILILLALYYLNSVITDSKIAASHKLAFQTYYLAEAGIHEAIWKLTNDQDWYNGFTTDPNWQASINRTNIFEPGYNYQVSAKNIKIAQAEITATSTINFNNQISQRVVKTKVYKALNPYLSEIISTYTNDNINITGGIVNVNDSNIYSNGNISLSFLSTLNVDGEVAALNNISKSWGSAINASALHSINYPPPPELVEMPEIDFDSDSPNSYLNLADQIFTQQEFENYLSSHPNAIFNGITYVQGNTNIQKGVNLTINGILVTDGNFKIGVSSGKFWLPNPEIHINHSDNQPSGLISKKSITFGSILNNVTVNGLIYSGNTVKIDNLTFPFTVNGGIIAYNLDLTSLWQNTNINYNQEIINSALNNPTASPLIDIEHWEEEY